MEIPFLSPSDDISAAEIDALTSLARAAMLTQAQYLTARVEFDRAETAVHMVEPFNGPSQHDACVDAAKALASELIEHENRTYAIHAQYVVAYTCQVTATWRRIRSSEPKPQADTVTASWLREPSLRELQQVLASDGAALEESSSESLRARALEVIDSIVSSAAYDGHAPDLLRLSEVTYEPDRSKAVERLAAFGEEQQFDMMRHQTAPADAGL